MKKSKFNLFDVAVILVLALVLVSVYFKAQSFLGEGSQANTINEIEGTLELRVEGVREVTVNSYKVGDRLIATDTQTSMGEIAEIEVIPYLDITEDGKGNFVEAQVPNRYTVVIYLDHTIVETSRGFIIGGYDAKIGKQIFVENKYSKALATIWGIKLDQ